jgi:hypothetical protein
MNERWWKYKRGKKKEATAEITEQKKEHHTGGTQRNE